MSPADFEDLGPNTARMHELIKRDYFSYRVPMITERRAREERERSGAAYPFDYMYTDTVSALLEGTALKRERLGFEPFKDDELEMLQFAYAKALRNKIKDLTFGYERAGAP